VPHALHGLAVILEKPPQKGGGGEATLPNLRQFNGWLGRFRDGCGDGILWGHAPNRQQQRDGEEREQD